MSRRKNEAVTVDPCGILGVVDHLHHKIDELEKVMGK
jgi:hypothetical protein